MSSLSQTAARAIRDRIIDGKLPAGEKLPPERVLLEELGVSRPVLREALKMLEAMGLVRARRGRGLGWTVVAASDETQSLDLVRGWLLGHREAVEHLVELRSALEPLAIQSLSDSDRKLVVKELDAVVRESVPAIARRDIPALVELDVRFHKALCSATANVPLGALTAGLAEASAAATGAVYSLPKTVRESLAQHRRIVTVLRRGDVCGAQELLRRHFERSSKLVASLA